SVDGTVIGTGTASSENGSFNIAISKLTAGTEVSVTATDAAGNVSVATVVTVLDVTAPEAPKVNSVIHNDTVVTGLTEAGATVKVKMGGDELGTVVADSNGKFSVTVSKQKHKNVLTVTATDAAGNISKATTVDVLKKNEK
uniref:Ig-like domain-containing protein n=1 Tax=Robertmurraya sp. TaxID=2837525 RepID=UPI0037041AAF